jgi:hypothetical protein
LLHALEDFWGGSGAADVPVFAYGIGADDEEVVGGGDAAVSGAGGEDKDVASLDGEGWATFSAEDDSCVAGGDAEDFVCVGMVMVEE